MSTTRTGSIHTSNLASAVFLHHISDFIGAGVDFHFHDVTCCQIFHAVVADALTKAHSFYFLS